MNRYRLHNFVPCSIGDSLLNTRGSKGLFPFSCCDYSCIQYGVCCDHSGELNGKILTVSVIAALRMLQDKSNWQREKPYPLPAWAQAGRKHISPGQTDHNLSRKLFDDAQVDRVGDIQ